MCAVSSSRPALVLSKTRPLKAFGSIATCHLPVTPHSSSELTIAVFIVSLFAFKDWDVPIMKSKR